MKLLFCLKCDDVFKLGYSRKVCDCGATSGYYEADGIHAKYDGDHAVPLGFQNASLVRALKNQPANGMGERFEAFVIPAECETFVRESFSFKDIIGKWPGDETEEEIHAMLEEIS